MGYVECHNHSHYSLLDGLQSIDDIIEWHVEHNLTHVVLTDHYFMYGILEFYKKAKAAGLVPVLGCEMGYTSRYMGSRELGAAERDHYHHITLLAKNNVGFKNLIKLNSLAATKGNYYNAMCDDGALAEYSEGIICLSGCYNGYIAEHIRNDEYDKARDKAILWRNIFGEDFYLEVMLHPVSEFSSNDIERQEQEEFSAGEEKIWAGMQKLSKELNIPMVATNDAHYSSKSQSELHDVLFTVGQRRTLSDPKRYKLSCAEFYLKTEAEMLELFPADVVNRSIEIVEKCHVEIEALSNDKMLLPKYPGVKDGQTEDEYLIELVYEGLSERGLVGNQEYIDRLEHELDTIISLEWSGYFIILAKILEYCRQNDITYGPGRGSDGGSLVCYCCHITNIDPVRHDLLFARFLDKSRGPDDPPDADIDLDSERRDEVIQYLVETYGSDRVAQIGTVEGLKGKLAFKKVASAMEIDFAIANQISSLMNEDSTVCEMLDDSKVRGLLLEEPKIEDALKVAERLEGGVSNVGVHAGGIVVSPIPITDLCPVREYKGRTVTQWDMDELHSLFFVKYDFLGLVTLSCVNKTLEEIRRNRNIEFDLETIPENDIDTFKLLSEGDVANVFQLESPLCREYLKKMRPTKFEDIMAFTSLIRPGPLSQPSVSGAGTMVDEFIYRSHGRLSVDYPHEKTKRALKSTLGVVIFQEQVMQIAKDVAGFTDIEANQFRGVISKKKKDEMPAQQKKFIEGCLANEISKTDAEYIFGLLETFSGYGFNKAHACGYSVITLWTAYLRTHFYPEFMAASLTYASKKKLSEYLADCNQHGVKLLPPDINVSGNSFVADGDNIRFSLIGVDGVGESATEEILATRERLGRFDSFQQFVLETNSTKVNKGVTSALIRAGAFDSLGYKRAQLLAGYEEFQKALKSWKGKSSRLGKKREKLQTQSWDDIGKLSEELVKCDEKELKDKEVFLTAVEKAFSVDVPEFTLDEILEMEKELMGFYISAHPLDKVNPVIDREVSCLAAEISGKKNKASVTMCGFVSHVREYKTQYKSVMAFIQLEDKTGTFKVTIPPKLYNKDIIKLENIILVRGYIKSSEKYGNDVNALEVVLVNDALVERYALEESSCLSAEILGEMVVMIESFNIASILEYIARGNRAKDRAYNLKWYNLSDDSTGEIEGLVCPEIEDKLYKVNGVVNIIRLDGGQSA